MAVPEIHKITQWVRTGADKFNDATYATPVETIAFWIDQEIRTVDSNGHEYVAMSRILTEDKIFNIGDRVQFAALGDASIEKSFIVKGVKFVENGRQTSRLHQALVGRDK